MSLLELSLDRIEFYENTTIGELSINGEFFCYTLEDAVRAPGIKIPGKTAIPEGTYIVKPSLSNRFGRVMPELLNVPQFKGIRMHGGNDHGDTSGCILVGQKRFGKDLIWDSVEEDLVTTIMMNEAIIRINNNPARLSNED